MFVSFAQNFEDVILYRAFADRTDGFYIDVGAQDPNQESVSRAFFELGWRGIHVEPLPEYVEALKAARPGDTVIDAAVSASEGPLEFYAFRGTGLSTGVKSIADRHQSSDWNMTQALTVPTITLQEVLEEADGKDIHWLKIDVEGMEADVLESWGDSEIRPWVLVVESTLPNSRVESFGDWIVGVKARGYEDVYFDGLNRFFLHENHPELRDHFGIAPNIFDDFVLDELTPYVGEIRNEVANTRKRLANTAKELDHVKGELADTKTINARDLHAAEEARRHLRTEVERQQMTIATLSSRIDMLRKDHIDEKATLNAQHTELVEAHKKQIEEMRDRYTQELKSLEDDAREAGHQRARLRTAKQEVETKLSKSRKRVKTLEASARRLKKQVETVRVELGKEKSRYAAQIRSLDARVASHTASEQNLLAKLRMSEQLRIASDNDRAFWHLTANNSQARVDALLSSTSWRVSAPFRWIGLGRDCLRAALLRLVRKLGRKCIRLARARPFLKKPVLRLANHIPILRRWINDSMVQEGSRMLASEFALTPNQEALSAWRTILSDTDSGERAP